MEGPPARPFRWLEALRTVCLFLGRPEALRLAVAVATTPFYSVLEVIERTLVSNMSTPTASSPRLSMILVTTVVLPEPVPPATPMTTGRIVSLL